MATDNDRNHLRACYLRGLRDGYEAASLDRSPSGPTTPADGTSPATGQPSAAPAGSAVSPEGDEAGE